MVFQDRIDYLKRKVADNLFHQSNDICSSPVVQDIKLEISEKVRKKKKSYQSGSVLFPTQTNLDLKTTLSANLDVMQMKKEEFHQFIKEVEEEEEDLLLAENRQHLLAEKRQLLERRK